MNKRNSLSRKNVLAMNMLKFSNTSVSSARARQQQRPVESTNGTNNGPNAKRRKHFNASTELPHVVSLMAMSLCRRITNVALIHRRLLIYLALVFIGGLLNDFASFLLRALFISLRPQHFLNQYLVKWAWAWNLAVLVPLVCLSSRTVQQLDGVVVAELEQSLEDYHEKRLSQKCQTIIQPIPVPSPSTKLVVSLQSLSANFQSQMADQYQARLLQEDQQSRGGLVSRIIRFLMVPDMARLLICTGIYLISTGTFQAIRRITGRPPVVVANTEVDLLTGNADSTTVSGGVDFSGHIFILIYSNLMIIEECAVMNGWEPLGDRLYSLSSEYMNLEMAAIQQELNAASGSADLQPPVPQLPSQYSQSNRMLFLCWHRYRSKTVTLRILFLMAVSLSIIWDFMLLQTAFFYHTLVEKLIALVWAYGAWYLSYRILFPLFGIQVRQVFAWI